jgi:CyaY protein
MTKILKTLNMSRIVMTDLEFLDTAESLLSRIEASCDRINDETDADIDNQRVGGMITISFSNRSQIIVNLQKPLHEVWLAAKSGGYHYKFKDGQWQDTKGAGEFFENLSRFASQQSGVALGF